MESALTGYVLEIASAAALLIWSVRLVRTGFERAFGASLRLWLRRSTRNRTSAAAVGALAAVLMQSSTAVAVLMAGFLSVGTIGSAAGLAILLGADVGSALVALILGSPVSAVMPLLLLTGVGLFLRSRRRRPRQIGRILIGFALIFQSLSLIRQASAPLLDSPGAAAVAQYLAQDMLAAFLLSAIFTWAVHSSVAAILLFVTLTTQGLLPPQAAFAMVMGANLGGAVIALVLTWNAGLPSVRRVILSNVVWRGGGAIAVVLALPAAGGWVRHLGETTGQQAMHLHLVFNLAMALLALPVVGTITSLARRALPDRPEGRAPEHASVLDETALTQPPRAMACARRELVHLGGRVESLLRRSIALFDTWDETAGDALNAEIARIAQRADALRLYLARIRPREGRDDETSAFDLAGIAVNLEAAAQEIGRSLAAAATRKGSENLRFSDAGWRDLTDFNDLVLRNAQLGISVLMTEDPALARELVQRKEAVRAMAQRLEREHLERLRRRQPESIATSAIHLEVLRSLKSVNSCFAVIAYPVLQERGLLLDSRLAQMDA